MEYAELQRSVLLEIRAPPDLRESRATWATRALRERRGRVGIEANRDHPVRRANAGRRVSKEESGNRVPTATRARKGREERLAPKAPGATRAPRVPQ